MPSVGSVHRDTILRLLVLAGERCQALMLAKLQNLSVKDVEVDEIWGYVGKKEGHKSDDDGAEVGDAYCFIGMERSTKLILAHHLGKRTAKATDTFIGKAGLCHFLRPLPANQRRIQPLCERGQNASP
jgi:hypothetical protein